MRGPCLCICRLQKKHLLPAVKAIHFCMEEGDKHFLWRMVEGASLREKTPECYWLCGLCQVIFNKRLPQIVWGVHFCNCLGIKMGCRKGFTFSSYCKWNHFVPAGPCQCSTPHWLMQLTWLLWSQKKKSRNSSGFSIRHWTVWPWHIHYFCIKEICSEEFCFPPKPSHWH